MKYILLLSLLLCIPLQAEQALDITAIENLIGCHLAECKANYITKTDSSDTISPTLLDIEEVLSQCDNYCELDFAITALKKFTTPEQGLDSVYRLYLEKLQNATLNGRRDLGEIRTKLNKGLESLTTRNYSGRNILDRALRRGLVVISIEDDGKNRRIELFKQIINRHRAELISSCEQESASNGKKLYNFVVEGNESFTTKTANHYKGYAPRSPFIVKIHMKSGGFFTEKWDTITANAPAEMKVNGSISWIKSTVIGEGWKYIQKNHPENFEKHAKIKDVNGRKVYKIDNGVLKYQIISPEKSLLVDTAERNDGDIYLDL